MFVADIYVNMLTHLAVLATAGEARPVRGVRHDVHVVVVALQG